MDGRKWPRRVTSCHFVRAAFRSTATMGIKGLPKHSMEVTKALCFIAQMKNSHQVILKFPIAPCDPKSQHSTRLSRFLHRSIRWRRPASNSFSGWPLTNEAAMWGAVTAIVGQHTGCGAWAGHPDLLGKSSSIPNLCNDTALTGQSWHRRTRP